MVYLVIKKNKIEEHDFENLADALVSADILIKYTHWPIQIYNITNTIENVPEKHIIFEYPPRVT